MQSTKTRLPVPDCANQPSKATDRQQKSKPAAKDRVEYTVFHNQLPYFVKYFELVFFQLQLLKMSCKLAISGVNYEKNKKGSFSMKHRVYGVECRRVVVTIPRHCSYFFISLRPADRL